MRASLIESINTIHEVVIEIDKLGDSEKCFEFALPEDSITLLLMHADWALPATLNCRFNTANSTYEHDEFLILPSEL